MTEFVITEQLQNQINHYRGFTGIVLSVTVGPPAADLIFPNTLTNPVMFTFKIHNAESGQTGDIQVVVPDTIYNLGVVDYGGADVEFLKQAIGYNDPDNDIGCLGLANGCVICPDTLSFWIDTETHQFVPIMGIDHIPVDQTTVDPMLQTLLDKIKQIPGIVNVLIYKFNDPARLEKLETTLAYKCYCYFGDGNGTNFDGLNNVATVIPSEVYLNEICFDTVVENIKTLLEKALLTNQAR
jgi:hypothetical protein